jgi:hypothetical protein
MGAVPGRSTRSLACMTETTIRDNLTDAIRYWEPRRIAYNSVLAVIVVAVFALQWPNSRAALSVELAQGIFVLAVLANVAYCAAYVVDLAAQSSAFRETWRRYRWVLFAIGVIFASIITRVISMGMTGHAG